MSCACRARAAFAVAALVAAPGAAAARAEPLALDRGESLLAVVTRRAGAASRLAHDHLVVAGDYRADVAFDAAAPVATRLAVELPAAALVVDDPAQQRRWQARLLELGILPRPFGEPSASDRAKIRDSMLSARQLDVERHPEVAARLLAVREEPTAVGAVAFSHTARLALTIHGQTLERDAAARWEERDGVVTLEGVAALRFSDFGIEPFSAFLGAVRNQDDFFLYVRLVGRPAAP